MNHNTMSGEERQSDPSQLALPYVESGMRFKGFRGKDLWYGLPGYAALGGALGAATFGANDLVIPLASIGAPMSVIPPVFSSRSDDSTSGLDRVRAPLRYTRQKRDYPLEPHDAADIPFHGVQKIRRDGTAIMSDGRMVALLRLSGRNTDTEMQHELQRTLSTLSTRIDERLDFSFRYHSTTTNFDPTEISGAYREAAFSEQYGGGEWALARELLHDVADWYSSIEAERWDARDWRHYVVVEIGPEDVDATGMDMEGTVMDGIREVFGSGADVGPSDEEWFSRMAADLSDRVNTAAMVFGSVPGVEVEKVGPAENALLHSRYWSGVEHNFNSVDGIRDGRLAELLSAPSYDARDDHLRVGDQFVRTYWVNEWPTEPSPGFLRPLVTMRDVEVDITLHATERDKENTKHWLKRKIAALDADVEELEEATDFESLTVSDDMEAYVKAYKILHHTSTQPWDLNGYITVRAGTREALDDAEDAIESGTVEESPSLDVQKRRTFEDKCDSVRGTAESSPASLTLMAPDTRQRDLFLSGSPTGSDVYADVSHRDRYSLVLGGVLGAAFPALAADIRHDEGIEWGRSKLDGAEVRADPFNVGGPGHALFIGDSGSGKTYSTMQKALRWWLTGDDRTLILCDTFGDFAGVTEILNGDRVVLGGEQTINPLHITPTPEHLRDSGLDPFGMKIESVNAFISGVLREQDVDPGDFTTLIKEVAIETYKRAGILPNDIDTHANPSPTMDDYLSSLVDVANNPDQSALSESDFELDEIEGNAAVLLRKLSGFQGGREYEHLVGESEAEISPGGVSYLDLSQMESQGAVGKSVMLQLMLEKVYQTVKRTPGETVFWIDEAHYLLHSEETVEWLQRASRHWRHYEAGVWFASQSPDEFISGDDLAENHQDTIRSQATTTQFTECDISEEHAKEFGMNEEQHQYITTRATRGDSGTGYSETLINFNDTEGWVRTQVRASPFEDALLTYDPADPVSLEKHIQAEYGEVMG